MVTDDPGTPGDGHFEINIAALTDKTSSGNTYELPLVDINYGIGERLQLKLETPYEVDAVGPRQSGIGNGLAGVKWRFYDAGDEGLQISTYPQVEFNYPHSTSDRRGLADRGTSLLLPLEVSHVFGQLEIGAEVGRWLRSDQSDSWICGFAIGRKISENIELMAEVHDEVSTAAHRSELLMNFGTRITLTQHAGLLFSIGRDAHNTLDESKEVFGYLGLQITL